MNAKEAINKISVLLGVAQEGETADTQDVKLEEATLLDGTKVRVEGDFEVGKPLFVITDEGDVYAPEGTHETETGLLISVDADGVITSIEDKPAEEEASAELEVKEDTISLSEEVVSKVMEALNTIGKNLTDLETRLNATEEKFHAFKNEPAGRKITNNLNQMKADESTLAEARFNQIVKLRKQTKQ